MGLLFSARKLCAQVLKHRVRCEITNLLKGCIDGRVCNDGVFNDDDCAVKRLRVFKKHMCYVKSSAVEWNELTEIGVNCESPTHIMVDAVLKLMLECEEPVKITHLLCLFTFVVDVCVIKQGSNNTVNACKVIETLVERLLDRNFDVCVKFLDFLDSSV